MGSGNWTTAAYNCAIRDMGFTSSKDILKSDTHQFFKQTKISDLLDPRGIRECCDSEEHPNTIPVILALDVTGSMGESAKMCAAKLDEIITGLYKDIRDIEFMVMGIGDVIYDEYPIQAGHFESDERILEQTAKIYFEGGGGPNDSESYTMAWYYGLNNCKLDCWFRGKKGIIITIGDEKPNDVIGVTSINRLLSKEEDKNAYTPELYAKTSEKYDIYHIGITDSVSRNYERRDGKNGTDIRNEWISVIGKDHYMEGKVNDIPQIIGQIIRESISNQGIEVNSGEEVLVDAKGICW